MEPIFSKGWQSASSGFIRHARNPRHRSYRPRSLHLAADRRGDPVLADRVQRCEHAQSVRLGGVGVPVPDHRAAAGADPQHAAQSRRTRHLAYRFDLDHHAHRTGDHLLHLPVRLLTPRPSDWMRVNDPWRHSTAGISVSLRVTPRGGRDGIDGIETLADGRSVVKLRVRAVAEGGGANRAVTEVLARALGVPKK